MVSAGVSNHKTYARVSRVSETQATERHPLVRRTVVSTLHHLIATMTPTAEQRSGVLLAVAGAAGAVILVSLLVGAARARRQASTIS